MQKEILDEAEGTGGGWWACTTKAPATTYPTRCHWDNNPSRQSISPPHLFYEMRQFCHTENYNAQVEEIRFLNEQLNPHHFVAYPLFRMNNLLVASSSKLPRPRRHPPSSSHWWPRPKSPSPNSPRHTNSPRTGVLPTTTKTMPPVFAITWSPPPVLPRVPTAWRILAKISRRKWLTLWVITGDFHRWQGSPVSRRCIHPLMYWRDITPVMGTSTPSPRRGGRDCIRNMRKLTKVSSVAVNHFCLSCGWEVGGG